MAKKIGVSHTAPYRHFKDKESLLAGIAAIGFRELTTQIAQAVEMHSGDPAAQLLEAGHRYVQMVIENPQCVQLMFGGILPCDDTYPELRESGDLAFDRLKMIIEEGQSMGIFKKAEIELMALTLWSSIHGLSLLFISGSLDEAVAAKKRAYSERLFFRRFHRFTIYRCLRCRQSGCHSFVRGPEVGNATPWRGCYGRLPGICKNPSAGYVSFFTGAHPGQGVALDGDFGNNCRTGGG